MKNTLTLLGLVFVTMPLLAQYRPQYTQFMFNKMAYNPAVAGSEEATTIGALYRHQWHGVVGAPRTANLFGHGSFVNGRGGLGAALVSDRIGMVEDLSVSMSYAYRIPLGKHKTVSIGLNGQYQNARLDWSRAILLDIDDVDLPVGESSKSAMNFGAGIYYQAPRMFLGISVPNLMKNAFYDESYFGINSVNKFRAYYLMGGLVIPVNENVAFQPSVMLTYVPNAPFDADMQVGLLFADKFYIGGGYRLHDSLNGVIQYKMSRQFKIGLGLDYALSELQSYSPGSGEILLQYIFDFENESLKNIRFF